MSSPGTSRATLLASVIRRLGRTNTQSVLFSHALAADLGIGPTDLDCLELLQELGPTPAGQLAELMSLTTGAVTGMVDRLASAGFVARESDPADRRRVIVRPLAGRMAALDSAYEPLLRAATVVLASFSDADLRLMLDFQQRAGELFRSETERLRTTRRPAPHGPDFSAPLDSASSACLEFATGAFELRLQAGNDAALLYRALFEGAQPAVRRQGGTVTFRHRRMSLLDWDKHSGLVLLNPTVAWTIVLRQGVSQAILDLRELDLRQLSIHGGANKTDIALPEPAGRVTLLVEGGLSRVTIRHPPGVPAQLRIRGGANRLAFDGQRFGAVGGDVRLASPGWDLAGQRYDIEVQGGASRLEVSELPEASAARAAPIHTAQEGTR